MGADEFFVTAKGKTPNEAFTNAVRDARYEHGNGGYTGTIAEKGSHGLVMITVPAGQSAVDYASQLVEDEDGRIDDKYGPTGCIDLKNGSYLFFGWASS